MEKVIRETQVDYSAKLSDVQYDELVESAIVKFQKLCQDKIEQPSDDFLSLTPKDFLEFIGLTKGGLVTFAAVMLFGSENTLKKYFIPFEITLMYLVDDATFAFECNEYCDGFMVCWDDLWQEIDRRNLNQHFLDGAKRVPIRTFDKISIREAIVNAVAHGKYDHGVSIQIKQYPEAIEISNYRYPSQITDVEGFQNKPVIENPLLAESLARAGLMTNSGRGVAEIIRRSVIQGKPLPEYKITDSVVKVKLDCKLVDAGLAGFFHRLDDDKVAELTVSELQALVKVDPQNGAQEPVYDELLAGLVDKDILVKLDDNEEEVYCLNDGSSRPFRDKG